MALASHARRHVLIAAVSIAVAVVLCASVWAGLVYFKPSESSNSGLKPAVGPGITINAFTTGPGGGGPAGDASITIFSAIPSAMSSSHSWTNVTSGGELQLFEGNTTAAGVLIGNLDLANWTTVTSQWPGLLSAITTTVSLQAEATWQEFNNSSQQWQLYGWQDAMGYNPWVPPTSFHLNVYFDLSRPAGILNMPPPGPPPGPHPPPHLICPSNPPPTWKTNYNGYITGPLPLFMVNNTLRTMNPSVTFAETIASTHISANFTEAGGTDYANGYTASTGTGTTWGGTAWLNLNGSSGDALSQQNASFGILYWDNVTLHVLRQTESLSYYTQPLCQLWKTSAQFGTVNVANVTDRQFEILTDHLPSAWGEYINKITTAYKTISNGSVQAGHSVNWGTLTAATTGTSSGESLLHRAAGVASIILAALGLGLAIMTMASACWVFCGAGEVATAITVATAVAGYLTTILTAIQSFSYTVSTSENLTSILVSAVHSAYNFQALCSSYGTGISTSSGAATAYMPSDIIAW